MDGSCTGYSHLMPRKPLNLSNSVMSRGHRYNASEATTHTHIYICIALKTDEQQGAKVKWHYLGDNKASIRFGVQKRHQQIG